MTTPSKLMAILATAVAGAGGGALVVAAAGPDSRSSTTTVTEAAAPIATKPVNDSSGGALSAGEIYERAKNSVAFITAKVTQQSNSPFGGGSSSGEATGTGFVVSNDGYLVTNAHVVEGASDVRVKIGDGKEIAAQVVGRDESTDIALLKVDTGGKQLTPLQFDDSSAVKVGDPTYAIGNPFGLSRTLTTGVVSALQRQIQAPDGFSINDVIQTDAALNPGNSGGPLLDAHGNVIGVNSQIATGSSQSQSGQAGNVGIGFAVPSNTVKSVVEQLRGGGSVSHAYLGVQAGDADGGGAQIGAVTEGGPAAKAGLARGDVVVGVDGAEVADASGLTAKVAGHKAGDRIELKVRRDGKERTVTVTLGDRPQQTGSSAQQQQQGQGDGGQQGQGQAGPGAATPGSDGGVPGLGALPGEGSGMPQDGTGVPDTAGGW